MKKIIVCENFNKDQPEVKFNESKKTESEKQS